MSTDFRMIPAIKARDLFDGRLEPHGVREHINPESGKSRLLTDGNNYLWASINDAGVVVIITRYGGNAPNKILNAIGEEFDTSIVSEHEPQFWGFATHQEWDDAVAAMAKEDADRFYIQILKHVRGEPSGIDPKTIGWRWAEIAKTLIANDTSLLLLENKDRLLGEMHEIDRGNAVIVTLTPQEIAAAKLSVTHEDDLPRS